MLDMADNVKHLFSENYVWAYTIPEYIFAFEANARYD